MIVLSQMDLSYLFLEQPWPMIIALLGAAAVLRTLARRRKDLRLLSGCYIAAAIAIGISLLAYFVTTGRETLLINTRDLVNATAPYDAPTVDRLLGDNVSIVVHTTQVERADRKALQTRLSRAIERFEPEQQRIKAINAQVRPDGVGESIFELTTKLGGELSGFPAHTVWELTWRKDGDGAWRVIEIRWIGFENQPASPDMLP